MNYNVCSLGRYDCTFCDFSTQDLESFELHVLRSHFPNPLPRVLDNAGAAGSRRDNEAGWQGSAGWGGDNGPEERTNWWQGSSGRERWEKEALATTVANQATSRGIAHPKEKERATETYLASVGL